MKTISLLNKPDVSSTFRVTVLPEDFTLPSATKTAPTKISRTPFADLMLHPEQLKAALRAARMENDAFNAARTHGRNGAGHAAPDSRSKNRSANGQASLKEVEFQLTAPMAKSVKLAADFTNWEKYSLDMIRFADGVWSILVPLPPGNYSYRFIVDGKWCDDPCADFYETNPFGTGNAVINVT